MNMPPRAPDCIPHPGRRKLLDAAGPADVTSVRAPSGGPFPADITPYEQTVAGAFGASDEGRIENSVKKVVASHLLLVGVIGVLAPGLFDGSVAVEYVGSVPGLP